MCDQTHLQQRDIIEDIESKIQAITGTIDNVTLISFRGSSYMQNWLDDADTFKTEYYNKEGNKTGYVHSGFKRIADQMFKSIKEKIDIYGNNNVFMTGHSLGAAISALVGLRLQENTSLSVEIYTYGQPRIGDESFANYTDGIIKNYYRIINNRDIVPHLPIRYQGFTHAGKEVWMVSQIEYVFNEAESVMILRNYNVFSDLMQMVQKANTRQIICNRESNNCSNSLYWYSLTDHLVYYNELISRYCDTRELVSGLLGLSVFNSSKKRPNTPNNRWLSQIRAVI